MRMKMKMRKVKAKNLALGLLVLVLVFSSIVAPVEAAKAKSIDHITFVKLSDINFADESGQGISMTKGWLTNLLKVEWGYGSYTNATLAWDGEKLTVYLQDDEKHDGRWFALNSQILEKVGIDPDKVSVKLDTQAPAEVVKRLKADGKWFYFYVDHFTTRYVTFEAEEGYVEYDFTNSSWRNYVELYQLENGSVVPANLIGNFTSNGSYALSFDGEDDYVKVTFSSPLPADKLTYITIFYDDAWDENGEGYIGGKSSDGDLVIDIHSVSWTEGGLYSEYYSSTEEYINTKIADADFRGSWHMVAATLDCDFASDTATTRTYLDGVFVAKRTNNAPKGQDVSYIEIGKMSIYGSAKFAVFLLYTRILSDTEIQTIYNDPLNPPTDGLVLWLAPDSVDTQNGLWLDKSDNGNNGTIYNAPYVPLAVLSAPSASFDGSQFLVNITAQLPNDENSYLLLAPKDAQGLTSIGQIGNFTFFDVGTASEVSYTLPVPADLSPPLGIGLLAFLCNDEIYMTGQTSEFPVVATVMNLPKGVWELEGGDVEFNQVMTNYTKLIIANVSAPAVVKRSKDLLINPTYEYVNVTVMHKDADLVKLNTSAPSGEKVVFKWDHPYKLRPIQFLVDGKVVEEKVVTDDWVEFTYSNWSTHIITLQGKPYEEISNQWTSIAVNGLIGMMILFVFIENTSLKENKLLKKGLLGLTVALFIIFVLSLL